MPYTDVRVRAVFARWRELVDRGCFTKNHASLSWQESQALLYQGKAAMMLIGNYIVPNFPPDIRDRDGFRAISAIAPGHRPLRGSADELHPHSGAARATRRMRGASSLTCCAPTCRRSSTARCCRCRSTSRPAIADDRFLKQGRDLLAQADGADAVFRPRHQRGPGDRRR